MWRATIFNYAYNIRIGISIHALRVESDDSLYQNAYGGYVISIHALRVESDTLFLSSLHFRSYFNPRSPCGERQYHILINYKEIGISIHALRVESDAYTNAI